MQAEALAAGILVCAINTDAVRTHTLRAHSLEKLSACCFLCVGKNGARACSGSSHNLLRVHPSLLPLSLPFFYSSSSAATVRWFSQLHLERAREPARARLVAGSAVRVR